MMSAWARRMHRRAVTISSVVTSCGHSTVPYPTRMEKVKFGVPLDQVCKQDIPGPLLILILKLNKEAPYKKDIFRAPGHQANMKKLIHFLQHGRLVNIDNFSVYTIASVLKKFLRKLPGGIFGPVNEDELFHLVTLENLAEKRERIHRLIQSLPIIAQHLLVLLFGTFHAIAQTAERAHTGMSAEAIGVSVAPSFFHSCVSGEGGKVARMEDVHRFKVATCIMKFLIDNFGVSNLFGKENYEYYARLTGRILKVEDNWIFAFRYPPDLLVAARKNSFEAEPSWYQVAASSCMGLRYNLEAMSSQEECQSTPALVHDPLLGPDPGGPLQGGPNFDSYTRLSVSLEDNTALYKAVKEESGERSEVATKHAESTKSLTHLPQVHERQAARMKTRSEWFLNPSPCPSPTPSPHVMPIHEEEEEPEAKAQRIGGGEMMGGSEGKLIRRHSSREKRLVRRSSSKSKQDKENGVKYSSCEPKHLISSTSYTFLVSPKKACGSQQSNSTEVLTCQVTLNYKPRI